MILGYTHFQKNGSPDDDYALHIFEFYDIKNSRRYTKDLIKIGFFELTKNRGLTTNQKHWLDYFKSGVVDISAPKYIKKASNIIEFTNLAEDEKMVVDVLEKAEAIRVAEIHQGFLDGRTVEKNELAKALLRDGDDASKVMRITGLDLSQVNKLQIELQ